MEKIITAKDIAAALNMPVNTVRVCMSNGNKKINPQKLSLVREYAKSVGYDPIAAQCYGRSIASKECVGSRAKYIKGSPFSTYREFIKHCENLRKAGWTNAEIAKGCGCSHLMVLRAIGRQPKEYTEMSMAVAGEKRARKNAARRERVEALRKAEAERKRSEISAQIAEAERQVEEYQMRWNEALQTASKLNHDRVEKMLTIAELRKRLQEVA